MSKHKTYLHNFLVPETLNPGFTGFMETTYAGILHREQWPDLDLKLTLIMLSKYLGDQMNSGIGVSF
jgi:hypothetical protein